MNFRMIMLSQSKKKKAKLCYMGTDSFVINTFTEDFFEDIKNDVDNDKNDKNDMMKMIKDHFK